MTTANTCSCPFCNAQVPIPPVLPPSGRLVCPLCEESFPCKDSAEAAAPASPNTPALADALEQARLRHQAMRQQRAIHSVRRSLLLVGALGGLGLSLGLLVMLLREPPPAEVVSTPAPQGVPVRKPGELPGLGYLPERTNAVIGLHVGQMIDSLDRTRSADLPTALREFGLPNRLLELFTTTIGIPIEEIDSLVFGARLEPAVAGGGAFPPLVLVMQTRHPLDQSALRTQWKARTQEQAGRTIYSIRTNEFPLELFAWFSQDQTLVVTLNARDFQEIPPNAAQSSARLQPEVSELIEAKLAPDSLIWLAAHSPDWSNALGPLRLLGKAGVSLPFGLPNVDGALLPSISLAYRWEEDKRGFLSAFVRLANARKAEELRHKIQKQFPPSENPTLQSGGANEWIYVRLPARRERVSEIIEVLFPQPLKNNIPKDPPKGK